MSLQFSPPELCFAPPLNRNQSLQFSLSNTSANDHLNFKIKTTAPTRYTVRPNLGVLSPGSSQLLQITIHTSETMPLDSWNDKFMIQYFMEAAPNDILNEKLRVVFGAANSVPAVVEGDAQNNAVQNMTVPSAPPLPLLSSLRPEPSSPVQPAAADAPIKKREKIELSLQIRQAGDAVLRPGGELTKHLEMVATVGEVKHAISLQYNSEIGHADEIIGTLPIPSDNIDAARNNGDGTESVTVIAGFIVRKGDNSMERVERVKNRFITNIFSWDQATGVTTKGITSLTSSGDTIYNLVTSLRLRTPSQSSEIPPLKTKVSVRCNIDLAKIIALIKRQNVPPSANITSLVIKSLYQHMLEAKINLTSSVDTLQQIAKILDTRTQDSSFRVTTKHLFEVLSMLRKIELNVSLQDLTESSQMANQDTRILLDFLFGNLVHLLVPRMWPDQQHSVPTALNQVTVDVSNSVFYQAFSGWSYLSIITNKCSLKISASPASSEILLALSSKVLSKQELDSFFETLIGDGEELSIPAMLLDPISMELMEDPVVTVDGHTYERAEIEKWFERNDTSPLTGLQLSSKSLIPNFLVRSQIKEFKERHAAYFQKQ